MYNPNGVLHKEEVTNNRQRSLTRGITRRTWVRIPPLQQYSQVAELVSATSIGEKYTFEPCPDFNLKSQRVGGCDEWRVAHFYSQVAELVRR